MNIFTHTKILTNYFLTCLTNYIFSFYYFYYSYYFPYTEKIDSQKTWIPKLPIDYHPTTTMDKLLETIEDIKTMIPDAKYMTLMETLTKMHNSAKSRFTPLQIKLLTGFLTHAIQSSNTQAYMNYRYDRYNMIITATWMHDIHDTDDDDSLTHIHEVQDMLKEMCLMSVFPRLQHKLEILIDGCETLNVDTACTFENFTMGDQFMNFDGTRPSRQQFNLLFNFSEDDDICDISVQTVEQLKLDVLAGMIRSVVNNFT